MKKSKTVKTKSTDQANAMIGKYFHSIVNDKVLWQGCVIGNPEPGIYLLQLFEWLMGEPNVIRIVRIEEMKDWFFYNNGDEMVLSYEHGAAKRKKSKLDSSK